FVKKCPAAGSPTACRVTAIADVGSDADPRKPRARIRLAVHVVRLRPGGAPVVAVADSTRRANTSLRRIYAQAGVAPSFAKSTENPARFHDPPGSRSADIVIKEAGGAAVTIDQVVSTDSGGHLTVGVVNPATLQSWDGTNFLVGSIEQRALLKNYDTGSDRI